MLWNTTQKQKGKNLHDAQNTVVDCWNILLRFRRHIPFWWLVHNTWAHGLNCPARRIHQSSYLEPVIYRNRDGMESILWPLCISQGTSGDGAHRGAGESELWVEAVYAETPHCLLVASAVSSLERMCGITIVCGVHGCLPASFILDSFLSLFLSLSCSFVGFPISIQYSFLLEMALSNCWCLL